MRLWKRKTLIAGICLLILWFWTTMAQAAVENDGKSKLASVTQNISPCVVAAATVSGKAGSHSHHSVTLSWKASIPASKSAPDSVQGYYVYRSQVSQIYAPADRLNAIPIEGNSCIDSDVKPRTTYFYSVKAVSQSGAQSALSEEVKAVIPFP